MPSVSVFHVLFVLLSWCVSLLIVVAAASVRVPGAGCKASGLPV